LFAAAPRARTAAVAGTLADVARTHGQIRIGTSGWSYGSWREPFFPREVMVKHHLAYYASQFDTTELNGVFYRTPTVEAVRGWRTTTPDDFVFAWKASKFITHWSEDGHAQERSLLDEVKCCVAPRNHRPKNPRTKTARTSPPRSCSPHETSVYVTLEGLPYQGCNDSVVADPG
jgi:hypothetical protein